MLAWKTWRETRTRFALSAAALAWFCGIFVLMRPEIQYAARRPFARAIVDAIYAGGVRDIYVLFVVALGLGGLTEEAARGSAPFTLALPWNDRISSSATTRSGQTDRRVRGLTRHGRSAGRLGFDDGRAGGRRNHRRHRESCSCEQRFKLPSGSLRASGQRHYHHVRAAEAGTLPSGNSSSMMSNRLVGVIAARQLRRMVRHRHLATRPLTRCPPESFRGARRRGPPHRGSARAVGRTSVLLDPEPATTTAANPG